MHLIQHLVLTFPLISHPHDLSSNSLNTDKPSRPDMHYTDAGDTLKLTSHFSRKVILEDSLMALYNSVGLEAYDLSYEVFRYGMIGYFNLKEDGRLSNDNILSIIDFTKPSSQKRFYTIDLKTKKIRFHTYVSHGKNTGENNAERFSNVLHSNQSSLGFYITAETYIGSKGFSLKLDGIEKGYNDLMRERAVVMHEADYVSERWIKDFGRLGRSQGCPALPKDISRDVIKNIKDRTLIFAYFNDTNYLNESLYLSMDTLLEKLESRLTTVIPPATISAFATISEP